MSAAAKTPTQAALSPVRVFVQGGIVRQGRAGYAGITVQGDRFRGFRGMAVETSSTGALVWPVVIAMHGLQVASKVEIVTLDAILVELGPQIPMFEKRSWKYGSGKPLASYKLWASILEAVKEGGHTICGWRLPQTDVERSMIGFCRQLAAAAEKTSPENSGFWHQGLCNPALAIEFSGV